MHSLILQLVTLLQEGGGNDWRPGSEAAAPRSSGVKAAFAALLQHGAGSVHLRGGPRAPVQDSSLSGHTAGGPGSGETLLAAALCDLKWRAGGLRSQVELCETRAQRVASELKELCGQEGMDAILTLLLPLHDQAAAFQHAAGLDTVPSFPASALVPAAVLSAATTAGGSSLAPGAEAKIYQQHRERGLWQPATSGSVLGSPAAAWVQAATVPALATAATPAATLSWAVPTDGETNGPVLPKNLSALFSLADAGAGPDAASLSTASPFSSTSLSSDSGLFSTLFGASIPALEPVEPLYVPEAAQSAPAEPVRAEPPQHTEEEAAPLHAGSQWLDQAEGKAHTPLPSPALLSARHMSCLSARASGAAPEGQPQHASACDPEAARLLRYALGESLPQDSGATVAVTSSSASTSFAAMGRRLQQVQSLASQLLGAPQLHSGATGATISIASAVLEYTRYHTAVLLQLGHRLHRTSHRTSPSRLLCALAAWDDRLRLLSELLAPAGPSLLERVFAASAREQALHESQDETSGAVQEGSNSNTGEEALCPAPPSRFELLLPLLQAGLGPTLRRMHTCIGVTVCTPEEAAALAMSSAEGTSAASALPPLPGFTHADDAASYAAAVQALQLLREEAPSLAAALLAAPAKLEASLPATDAQLYTHSAVASRQASRAVSRVLDALRPWLIAPRRRGQLSAAAAVTEGTQRAAAPRQPEADSEGSAARGAVAAYFSPFLPVHRRLQRWDAEEAAAAAAALASYRGSRSGSIASSSRRWSSASSVRSHSLPSVRGGVHSGWGSGRRAGWPSEASGARPRVAASVAGSARSRLSRASSSASSVASVVSLMGRSAVTATGSSVLLLPRSLAGAVARTWWASHQPATSSASVAGSSVASFSGTVRSTVGSGLGEGLSAGSGAAASQHLGARPPRPRGAAATPALLGAGGAAHGYPPTARMSQWGARPLTLDQASVASASPRRRSASASGASTVFSASTGLIPSPLARRMKSVAAIRAAKAAAAASEQAAAQAQEEEKRRAFAELAAEAEATRARKQAAAAAERQADAALVADLRNPLSPRAVDGSLVGAGARSPASGGGAGVSSPASRALVAEARALLLRQYGQRLQLLAGAAAGQQRDADATVFALDALAALGPSGAAQAAAAAASLGVAWAAPGSPPASTALDAAGVDMVAALPELESLLPGAARAQIKVTQPPGGRVQLAFTDDGSDRGAFTPSIVVQQPPGGLGSPLSKDASLFPKRSVATGSARPRDELGSGLLGGGGLSGSDGDAAAPWSPTAALAAQQALAASDMANILNPELSAEARGGEGPHLARPTHVVVSQPAGGHSTMSSLLAWEAGGDAATTATSSKQQPEGVTALASSRRGSDVGMEASAAASVVATSSLPPRSRRTSLESHVSGAASVPAAEPAPAIAAAELAVAQAGAAVEDDGVPDEPRPSSAAASAAAAPPAFVPSVRVSRPAGGVSSVGALLFTAPTGRFDEAVLDAPAAPQAHADPGKEAESGQTWDAASLPAASATTLSLLLRDAFTAAAVTGSSQAQSSAEERPLAPSAPAAAAVSCDSEWPALPPSFAQVGAAWSAAAALAPGTGPLTVPLTEALRLAVLTPLRSHFSLLDACLAAAVVSHEALFDHLRGLQAWMLGGAGHALVTAWTPVFEAAFPLSQTLQRAAFERGSAAPAASASKQLPSATLPAHPSAGDVLRYASGCWNGALDDLGYTAAHKRYAECAKAVVRHALHTTGQGMSTAGGSGAGRGPRDPAVEEARRAALHKAAVHTGTDAATQHVCKFSYVLACASSELPALAVPEEAAVTSGWASSWVAAAWSPQASALSTSAGAGDAAAHGSLSSRVIQPPVLAALSGVHALLLRVARVQQELSRAWAVTAALSQRQQKTRDNKALGLAIRVLSVFRAEAARFTDGFASYLQAQVVQAPLTSALAQASATPSLSGLTKVVHGWAATLLERCFIPPPASLRAGSGSAVPDARVAAALRAGSAALTRCFDGILGALMLGYALLEVAIEDQAALAPARAAFEGGAAEARKACSRFTAGLQLLKMQGIGVPAGAVAGGTSGTASPCSPFEDLLARIA